MKYIIVRKEGSMNFPVIDKQGDVVMFDNELEADIERIYLQPDYDELLVVYISNIDEKKINLTSG